MSHSHQFERLPLTEQYQIDQICTRFEQALRECGTVDFETYLSELPLRRTMLFAELLAAEIAHRRRSGQVPVAADYIQRFPDLSQPVYEAFAIPANADTIRPEGVTEVSTVPRLPHIEGYEIHTELGRGGMGVVYKARHLALHRTVALKMLLTGDFAGPAELTRFLIEGEMLARLDHPNIVKVFEVGQRDGRPFLALEFLPGGTLAEKTREKPLTFRDAARMVEQLAGAVHHAHSNGVLHRDLKPQNILLGTDGEPKISDFGLARPTADGPHLTHTGLVLGTPSYMAPEQARGEGAIGPAADVYGLGAILYQLLSHRPPFRGSTTAETIRQVLEHEPARPSVVNPRVPRDLESIVLMALRKDPKRRYRSADALAEDLRRWREGEPITARPVGFGERIWKWMGRHPAQAALAAAVILGVSGIVGVSLKAASRLKAERDAVLLARRDADDAERRHRSALAEAVLTAAPEAVPYMLASIESEPAAAIKLYRDKLQDPTTDARQRLRAAVALSVLGEPRATELLDAVPSAPPAEGRTLCLGLKAIGSGCPPDLFARWDSASDLSVKARYAILLLELDDARAAQAMLGSVRDPSPRTIFIREFARWHGDLSSIPRLLRDTVAGDLRSGLCAALGQIDPATLPLATRQSLVEALSMCFRIAPDGGSHAAAEWALRCWQMPIPSLPPTPVARNVQDWLITKSGLTMMRVPPGSFHHTASSITTITRSYLLADREVPAALFQQFVMEDNGATKWPNAQTHAFRDGPVTGVNRRDMIRFCNWLSDREGRPRCYQPTTEPLVWTCDFSLDGYRLPTDAEWDHAQRTGSTTRFAFGDDPADLSDYARVSSLGPAIGGTRQPNRWGLFDMTGNVWEVCWDVYVSRPAANRTDPASPPGPSPWVSRGGAYDSGSYDTWSGYRTRWITADSTCGFRLAMTLPLNR